MELEYCTLKHQICDSAKQRYGIIITCPRYRTFSRIMKWFIQAGQETKKKLELKPNYSALQGFLSLRKTLSAHTLKYDNFACVINTQMLLWQPPSLKSADLENLETDH